MSPNSRLARRVIRERKVGVKEMLELGRNIEKIGEKVTFLTQGEPDFDTPEHIKEAAWKSMREGYTHYVSPEGLEELRVAIAQKLSAENGVAADPKSEIIVTNGAKLGLFLAIMSLIEPDDEVLLPDPAYGQYAQIVQIAGGKSVFVSCEEKGGRFVLPAEEMAKKITNKTKALIINNPDNPTGTVYTKEELTALADLAKEYDLYVIADEVYEKFLYDARQHCCFASLSEDARKRCILVNSFSKTYAMTGWRLGYNVANEEFTRAMTYLYDRSARCASAFVQRAGIAALRGSQICVAEMIAEYAARREIIVTGLNGIGGIRCHFPNGTFYAFANIALLGMNSLEFSRLLAEKFGLLVTPGNFYGAKGEGYIRLSFSASRQTIEEGLYKMEKCIKSL